MLLVGLGNTTGDVADSLVGVADSVYIAHNHGAYVVSTPLHILHDYPKGRFPPFSRG